MVKYCSTRGSCRARSFEEVLLAGLAPDGGLYVPETWPQIDVASLKGKSYVEIAEIVMFPFVEDSISLNDFRTIVRETYSEEIFRHQDVVPLHNLYPNMYVLEQFYGPTIAFKDVALQLVGRLFDHVLRARNKRVTIVGATSGDTGSAAIEGCRHSDHIDVFILHPAGRVSDVQRRQMTTIEAPNVFNIALEGNFDDCQNMVKAMFGDETFRARMHLSAVNSINWARIMAQIVYYFTSALALGAPDKVVTYIVPTGNFGNVLAGYCARKMGLPIQLQVATNRNDILTRFFESGEMKTADVVPTITPSMDIQISSNFERFLFDMLDRDPEILKQAMAQFKENGTMRIEGDLLDEARAQFEAFRTTEEETLAAMRQVFWDTGYILDPHTAVGMAGALDKKDKTDVPTVVLATAHPAKFPDAVEKAIAQKPELPEHLEDLFEKEEFMTTLPNEIDTVQAFIQENAHITSNKTADV